MKDYNWEGTDLLSHKIRPSSGNPIDVEKHKIPYKLIHTVNDQIKKIYIYIRVVQKFFFVSNHAQTLGFGSIYRKTSPPKFSA